MCVVVDAGAVVESAASDVRTWLVPRPGLFELLNAGERVVHVSAPAGSGNTFLLRSWIASEGLSERAAWVSVGRGERDAQAFWLSVLDSLRGTRVGSERVRELTPGPDFDGVSVVRRLLEDLGSLDEPLWLVIDDLHGLDADEGMREVELLLGSAPPQLRFVLLTRRDLRLGLHRLRVEGELTEIRRQDLRFTLDESRGLLEAVGLRLSDAALDSLVATTKGWAAGVRLAALSLGRVPNPERLAASFSGRQRAVAEYLLAEVIERQPQDVPRLLLRTSILERVSGPLADRLTGDSGSERILWALEGCGGVCGVAGRRAIVVSLPPLVRGPADAGAAPDRLARVAGPAHRRRGVVGRARASGRGGSPCSGGRELGPRGPAAGGQLALHVPRRVERHRPRAPVRVSRRKDRNESGAGGARRGRQAGGGVTIRGGSVSGAGGAPLGLGAPRAPGALPGLARARYPVPVAGAGAPATSAGSGFCSDSSSNQTEKRSSLLVPHRVAT